MNWKVTNANDAERCCYQWAGTRKVDTGLELITVQYKKINQVIILISTVGIINIHLHEKKFHFLGLRKAYRISGRTLLCYVSGGHVQSLRFKLQCSDELDT